MDSLVQTSSSWPSIKLTILFCAVLIPMASFASSNNNNVNQWRQQQSGGLQRSYSDSRFNRNGSSFQRQSSFPYYRRGSCSASYKFDYIQLTLMWAPGACSTSPQECRREENKHFTVHGMWPTIKGTQEPSNCCFDNTFNYKLLEPILPTLNDYWFSYYETSDSRSFWSHEWLKHGTCARDIPDLRGEALYFGTTVQMAKQMPILDYLKKANIIPDNDKVYQSSDIYNALSTIAQGKVFQIDCDYEHHQPIPILKGINFCFDKNLKPANCPDMKRKCQRQIIFPSTSTHHSRLIPV